MMFVKKFPNSHGYVSPHQLEQIWRDHFDFIYREYDYAVVPMTIHPDVSGRPQVLLMLERLIGHMLKHPGVRFVTLEDMAADFVGRTVGAWEPWLHALPEEFDSAETVFAEFGPIAGRYFLEAFDRTETGWRLHGRPAKWIEIAAEWGTRDYWLQWQAVHAPVLLIEAGDSVVPPGQMTRMAELAGERATYVRVAGAGHLVHDDAPEDYRRAVEAFLGSLPPR